MKLNRNKEIKYIPRQAYNKLNAPFTTFVNLIFFYEIWFSTCYKSVQSMQNKNEPRCKYPEICKAQNNYSNSSSNFKLVQ